MLWDGRAGNRGPSAAAARWSASDTQADRTDIPEVRRLATTADAWWPEVHGFLTTNVTNAGTEATNRTVKTVARTAYGFRNLDNQRRRVRYACTRQQRRVSAAA